MKKSGRRSLVFWIVFIVAGLALTFGYQWKPLLGLDLQGGLSATLVPKPGRKAPTTAAVQEATNIIRQRVDGLGIAEPDVVRSGKTVVVQLPGLKTKADQDRAKKIIGTTAKLEFREVLADVGTPRPVTSTTKPGATTTPGVTTLPRATTVAPSAPSTVAPTTPPKGSSLGAPGSASHGPAIAPVAWKAPAPPTTSPAVSTPPASGTPPAASIPLAPPTTQPQAQLPTITCDQAASTTALASTCTDKSSGAVYVLGPVKFSGTALSGATSQLSNGAWEVNVTVKNGSKKVATEVFNGCFSGIPTCPKVRQGDDSQMHGAIAMVLDGSVISAPTVNALDLPKNPQGFVITGNFTHKSANELALQLRYGALPVEFQSATLETVSATLGSSSLHAGIVSGLVGLGLVALYMLIFYRMLGLVAILSLLSSTALLWTVISYLGAHNGLALTLAGITGIIVSVGVAVDSNVVFYEHLREDMTKDRTLRATVHHSFDTAWKTIVSADFVSLIGAVILYFLTVGSVRGFAFYLGLATLTDLAASWFFMRPVVFWMANSKLFNDRPGILGVRPHKRKSTQLAAEVAS